MKKSRKQVEEIYGGNSAVASILNLNNTSACKSTSFSDLIKETDEKAEERKWHNALG